MREEAFTPLKLTVLEDHESDGRRVRAFKLPLADLAEGYHRLAILEGTSILGIGTVAVAPERCYLPPALESGTGRIWGTTVQLYGLRSARNAGIGSFTDLRTCAEIWGERGSIIRS